MRWTARGRWLAGLGLPLIVGLFVGRDAHAWKSKVENKFDFQPEYYFEDVGQSTSQWSTALRDQIDFSTHPSSNKDLRFHFSPYFYSDPSAPSQSEQFFFDVPLLNVERTTGDFVIKAGINSIAWGFTDVFNPLDVVSAHRYMDPMNSEKRGVPSLDINYEHDAWRLEALYVPDQLTSTLPGDKSRWLPRDLTFDRSTNFGEVILANQFEYSYDSPAVRDDALHNNFGFRVERHGSGLDLSAIFYKGAPTAPTMLISHLSAQALSVVDPSKPIVLANKITLLPTYYTRETFGVGAVLTLESAIIRFEATNSDRMDNEDDIPGWAQNAVIGIEKNISVGADSTVTALLQATWGNHEDQADNTITSLDRIFDQSFLLGFRLTTSTAWGASLAGLYDARYQGGYATLKIDRKVRDGMTASLGSDWLDGSAGTPLGTYRRNKRVSMELAVLF